MRKVYCLVLKEEAEGLDEPPLPGELGQRIYENISEQGWKKWLDRLTMIINENGLSTANTDHLQLIESHLKGFLFGEGNLGGLPSGFNAPGKK